MPSKVTENTDSKPIEITPSNIIPFKPKAPEPRIIADVPITLDAQPRTLRMDFRAMKLIEAKTGLVMWRGKTWEFDSLDATVLSTIIWACLRHESPDLTPDEVDAFPGMSLSNFTYITMTLMDLWGSTMPDADEPVPNATETPATT